MKHVKSTLFIVIILLFASCTAPKVGIQEHTGFMELPFPSNTYASGQIVEIYSSPRKVEITFDPQIPWDQASSSEGWDISAGDASTLKTKFATEISKVLTASANYDSTHKVEVEFTDTKTRLVPKNRIFIAIDKAITDNTSLKKQLKLYMEDGTHFDVITQTLSATISFKVVDSNNQDVAIDSEIIKKLNSDFNIDFKRQADSNKIISGSNLVVGIHYDPKMVNLLVN